MKKTLFKIAFVAVVSLSAMCKVQADSILSSVDALRPAEALNILSKRAERFSHLLAMGTQENLKAYHLGLKALFPSHPIPSAHDLFQSIRSHSSFLGSLTKDEALDRFDAGNGSLVIFEEKGRVGTHFYIVHSKGVRHFTVNEARLASIDNMNGGRYPSLPSLLKSTVGV